MQSLRPVRASKTWGVIIACALGGAIAAAAPEENAPTTAATGIEMQFIDPRIPEDERAVMTSAVGYALPPLVEGATWVGGAAPDLAALRGSVIVIQSYTRSDADGRAALRRTEDILKNMGTTGVQLIALHTPQGAPDAAKFFADKPPTTPTILDTVGAYCDELGVYERPVIIMIDRSGKIRYAGVALSKLRGAVELLVGEPFDVAAAPPPVLPARATRLPGEKAGAAAAPGAPPVEAHAKKQAFPPKPQVAANARDVFGKKGPSLDGLNFLTEKPNTDGKVVMMEFWATWCGPCVQNIPHMNELEEKFGDSVAIIGITDEAEAKIRSFLTTKKMDYTVALDTGGAINRELAIRGIPHAVIMSPDGIVRWQGHPAGLDAKTLQQIVDASGVTPGGASAKPKRWVRPT